MVLHVVLTFMLFMSGSSDEEPLNVPEGGFVTEESMMPLRTGEYPNEPPAWGPLAPAPQSGLLSRVPPPPSMYSAGGPRGPQLPSGMGMGPGPTVGTDEQMPSKGAKGRM